LFDVCEEDRPIHRPIDHEGGDHPVVAQSNNQGDGLPMAVGNEPDQSFAARATAPKSHQAGAGGGLVDEYQSGGIKQALLANPAPPRPRHVCPFLLRRAQAFFLTVTLCRSKNRQTAVRLPGIRCLRIATTISSKVRSGCLATRANSHSTCSSNGDVLPPLSFALAFPVTPALQPPHRRTGAQAEAFGRFPPRCSGHDGFDYAFPQVIRIGLRHRFGPPEPRINAARLAHSHIIGNPRFNSAGKRVHSARYKGLGRRFRRAYIYVGRSLF